MTFKKVLNLKEWHIIEKILLIIIIANFFFLIFIHQGIDLEIIATFFLLSSFLLISKRNILGYIFAVIGVSLYIIVLFDKGIYGEIPVQIYILITSIFGFFSWNKVKDSSGDIKARNLSLKGWLISIFLIIVFTLFYGLFISNFQSIFPYIVAFAVGTELISKILLIKRYIEQFYFWIVVDLTFLLIWIKLEEITLISLTIIYLLISFYGIYNWHQNEEKNEN